MVEEDQERILDEHIQVVREQAFHMKKSLDQNNLRDALKFSSTMLGEMKTSRLSPRNYFNLCKSIIPIHLTRSIWSNFWRGVVKLVPFYLVIPVS